MPVRKLTVLLVSIFLFGCMAKAQEVKTDSVFIEKPYLQMGDANKPQKQEQMVVLWQTADTDATWKIDAKVENGDWKPQTVLTYKRIAVPTIEAHRLYSATLTDLKPGMPFTYRVSHNGKEVFTATGVARKSAQQPFRFVVFGDCSEDTEGQKKVAYQTFLQKPDYVFITGDIVYSSGRISEYRKKYFPVYNTDVADPKVGAPLIRSTLFMSSPGNHDILNRNLDKVPDGLAYFLYWSQPLNGPNDTIGAKNTPTLSGIDANQKAFTQAAGSAYPRMANFSFDYGNAHWTVLDANPYMNWNDKAMRDWVAKDLESAKNATWRFVGFHQPGFNSSHDHFDEQYMRLLSDVFEAGKVDIVFNGHVHNYQRSFPLTFVPEPGQPSTRRIAGEWTLDKMFDGKKVTKPKGVIYIITGGGGAELYNPEQEDDKTTWQPFTDKYHAKVHSFTLVDVDGGTLKIRQVDENGKELDRFTITR